MIDGAVVVVVADEPVVVLVDPIMVVVVDKVVVADEVVVDNGAGMFLESSSPDPVRRSARSATERINRNGQRRGGKAFGELRISLSR